MHKSWLSFIPQHVLADLAERPQISPVGAARQLDVIALFADVSGFTAMSEALGRSGKRGTEELTETLNSYFDPMIELIRSYGGIVGKFGGDAMTVLFPFQADSQADRQATTRRAVQCALDMQARMVNYAAIETSGGLFALAMKAGLSRGRALCVTLGDVHDRIEYIIAGEVLDLCADAEHHADKGEVVIHGDLVPDLEANSEQVSIVEWRDDFVCLDSIGNPPAMSPLKIIERMPSQASPWINRFLHPDVAERLRQGLTGFIDEHRQVSILFVRFSGFDYDHDPAVIDKLQSYLNAVISIVQRYEGYLNKVDMGDKGSKYIVLFGAPMGHEDDEDRALRCALELNELPTDRPVQIGINTGFVYSGQVGSEQRREYTVMGDAVNMAARLMQAAEPGQILVGESTWQLSPDIFKGTVLPPMKMKGKSQPVQVYALEGVQANATAAMFKSIYELPLVGRDAELETTHAMLAAAKAGRGQILGIVAEAGVGKSRFAAEVMTLATQQGFRLLGGACQSYGTQIQYLVWRSIWQTFFELNNELPLDALHVQLTAALNKIDPQLLPRMPLLGPALNLNLPDNDTTQELEPSLRVELLRSLLLLLLRHTAAQQPLIIVLEDCHWIDTLSRELLAYLGRNIADLPILIVVAYRPTAQTLPLAWTTAEESVEIIELNPLTRDGAFDLALSRMRYLWGEQANPPAEFVDRLIERSGGNPFYLEEMVNYLHDQGVALDDIKQSAVGQIPDSLHSVIISRIDRLSESQKTILKVASVIGRTFRESWVRESFPLAGDDLQVRQSLLDLNRLDLTPLSDADPEPTYLFRHITTQEVAYESMAFSTRTKLHDAVGHFVEGRYKEQLDKYYDILAYHFSQSENAAKQRIYLRFAGDAAKEAFANQAAIDYYTRLLPLLEHQHQDVVLFELGSVRQLIGEWSDAEALYRQSLELAQTYDHPNIAAECALALGGLLFLSQPDAVDAATIWLLQARSTFKRLDDEQGLGRTLAQLSFAYSQQGKYGEALTAAQEQLRISEKYDDPAGSSSALGFIGNVYFLQGDFDEARKFMQQAVKTAQAADKPRAIILTSNDLAGVYYQLGDQRRALGYLQQAQQAAAQIGNQEMVGVCMGNAAQVYQRFGELERAISCYYQALIIADEVGDWLTISLILGNLATAERINGQLKLAEALYERAIGLVAEQNLPYVLAEYAQEFAKLLLDQNDVERARKLNAQARLAAEQAELPDRLLAADLLDILLDINVQKLDPVAARKKLLRLVDPQLSLADRAEIFYQLWKLDHLPAHQKEAIELYRDLMKDTPGDSVRKRFIELADESLPPLEPLPQPAQLVDLEPVALDKLLAHFGVDQ